MYSSIPRFATLPDGDLSGLTLSYQETRENCIPLDSDLYPTVDWPTLRIWANNGSGEQIYQIPADELRDSDRRAVINPQPCSSRWVERLPLATMSESHFCRSTIRI